MARCHYEQQFINVHAGSGGQDRRQRIRSPENFFFGIPTRTDRQNSLQRIEKADSQMQRDLGSV